MLTTIFKIPDISNKCLDFFFSALTTDPSITQKYAHNKKDNISIQINTKYQSMPVSLLKFLILSNINCQLADTVILSFFQLYPSLTFELIDRYSEKTLFEVWRKIIIKVQKNDFQDIHINVYYYFLLSSIKHTKLITLYQELKIQFYVENLIFSKNHTNTILKDQKMTLLLLYFLFCRISETISKKFISIHNIQSSLTTLISSQNQFESFVNYFVWILNPTNEFPIKEMNFTLSNEILSDLLPPSFTFSSKIAPLLLSLLMKIGVSDHFEDPSFSKLIDSITKIFEWEKNPSNLLLGITDESILTSLIPYAMKSEKYFYLLSSALSISCIFPVFSNIYSLIANDDQKLLNFLIMVSSSAPLVNDFLRIDTKHKLNFSCMNGTIAMWVRFLNHPAQIMKIKLNSNVKVYIKREENTFVLEVCEGISRFIPMNDDICGWYFIIIELKPKSITMSVNLAQVKIDYLFGSNDSISFGKKTSIFDLQSFHFFKSELSKANICRLYTLGPNYKTNFVDNFLSLSYEPLFVLKNNFISSLYIRWISSFHNKNLNLMPPLIDSKNSESLFGKNYEFGISPPYDQFYTTQKVQNTIQKDSILTKRFHFESFFNSLDAHGGISLLIHFLVEIILKKKELHSLAFNLFNVLVNRFPFIHYYFEENNVYRLIGQILWKSSPDSKSLFQCAMMIHNRNNNSCCIMTNVDVVKYWLFGPSLFKFEPYDLIMSILTSLEGEFAEENLQMLEIADCFNSIIKSISNSDHHTEKFLSILIALALKITNQNNAQKHASLIIKYLLVYHLKTQKKSETNRKEDESECNNKDGEKIKIDRESNKTETNSTNNGAVENKKIDNEKIKIDNESDQTGPNNKDDKNKKVDNENESNSKDNDGDDGDEKINIIDNGSNITESNSKDDKNKKIDDESNKDVSNSKDEDDCDDYESKKIENESNKTVSLIHLLSQILFNYGKKVTVSLKPLLLMFLNSSSSVLCSLYDLMMKYLDASEHAEFIVALSKSANNPEFSDYVYSYTTSFIFKANEASFQQFYIVTISLLFLLSQEHKEEKMVSILSSAATILDEFDQFPSFIFDHMYRFLCKIAAMKKMAYFFGHEVTSNSIEITPFCHFLLKLFVCAILDNNNGRSFEYAKSFIHGFFALDRGDYSVFVVSYLLDRLNDLDIKKCQQKVTQISNICCDLFLNISFILRERKVNPPPYIPFFIQHACNSIDFFNTTETVNCFLFLLNEISYNSMSIALSIVSIVSDCKVIRSLPNYQEIIGMLESPMMATSSSSSSMSTLALKQKKIAFKVDLSKFFNFINKIEENDINCFLTLYCDSVHSQTLDAQSIYIEQEANDDILQKWREIFTKLNFPGSQIYVNCQMKYKVDDSTVKYQIRRVLLPLNPSLDSQYLNFWETKYSKSEKKPIVRLKLKDVFENLNYSHTDEILFTSETSRLYGTSIIQGFFVVTKKTIKFYYENDDIVIYQINKIHSIRLIDYQHQPVGIFIDERESNNSSYISNSTMYAFKSKSIRIEFINNIEKNFDIKIIRSINTAQLNLIAHNWSIGRITNMEYLLYLNFLSGRNWSDLTRYPIFPWVCLDFSKSQPVMRDLRFPFFAQTDEQKLACIKYYRMTQEVPDEAPHYYSNYVSNLGSSLYFLVRLEPFTTEEIEYQGGSFDSPDRSFQSFAISADVMTHPGEKSTQELVPEVYFMPDFLLNVNGIKFPKSPLKREEIGDVKLPNWSKKKGENGGQMSPFKFVRKMRSLLESDEVSQKLNEWIDLVWGVRRSGSLADERFNVFSPIIYEFDHSKYCDNQKLMNAFVSLMHNCGQAPLQLFSDFHAKRQAKGSPSMAPFAARKMKFEVSARIEDRRPRASDLFMLGFDFKNINNRKSGEIECDDKGFTEFLSYVNKSVIFMCGKDSFVRIFVRKSCMSVEKVELGGKGQISTVFFADEIEPTLISITRKSSSNEACSGCGGFCFSSLLPITSSSSEFSDTSDRVSFVTSHKIPIINHWHFLKEKCQMIHITSLRGHMASITSLSLNELGSTVFAGHIDGVISSFRLSPGQFVRSIHCKRELPVCHISVTSDNSCLLAVQIEKKVKVRDSKSSIRFSSIVSLFEINGYLVAEQEINAKIIDCCVTSFQNGIQTNLAFLLTDSSKILVVSMNSLKMKAVVDAGEEKIVAISLWNNIVLVALTSENSLFSWNLFDLQKSVKKVEK